jgi:hypothetical protein
MSLECVLERWNCSWQIFRSSGQVSGNRTLVSVNLSIKPQSSKVIATLAVVEVVKITTGSNAELTLVWADLQRRRTAPWQVSLLSLTCLTYLCACSPELPSI